MEFTQCWKRLENMLSHFQISNLFYSGFFIMDTRLKNLENKNSY